MDLSFQTCPKKGQHFTVSGTSARNATAISSDLVTVHASADCYIKLGSSSVVASDTDYDFHLSGSATSPPYFLMRTNGATHIAAIQVSAGGTLYINGEK